MKISELHLKETCKIGQGKECCRYITMSALGFRCAKHTGMKSVFDTRVKHGQMVAQGDCCEGLGELEVFRN